MGFTWENPPDEVFAAGLQRYERDLSNALYQLAMSFAPRIEHWLKQSAKWVDRTGNLRQSLYSSVERFVNEIAIYIGAGLDYYVFVATKRAGYFDIVTEALDHWSVQVWQAVKVLIS